MTTLKFDIDEKVIDWKRIKTVLEMFKIKINISKSKIAKTKKGFHLYLHTDKKIKDNDICFIQLACNSDYKREVLNLLRLKRRGWQRDNFNVLFSQKYHVDAKGNTKLASEEVEMDNEILRRKLK
jgi:hypothetical protein